MIGSHIVLDSFEQLRVVCAVVVDGEKRLADLLSLQHGRLVVLEDRLDIDELLFDVLCLLINSLLLILHLFVLLGVLVDHLRHHIYSSKII